MCDSAMTVFGKVICTHVSHMVICGAAMTFW